MNPEASRQMRGANRGTVGWSRSAGNRAVLGIGLQLLFGRI